MRDRIRLFNSNAFWSTVLFVGFVLAFCRAGVAEVVTVAFSTTVTRVVGIPFGIVTEVGAIATGSISYDSATAPYADFVVNGANFPSTIPNGFVLSLGGVTISSSNFVVSGHNEVYDFDGSSDSFSASADPDGYQSMGGDFRVNGVSTLGDAQLRFADFDRTFYSTNVDVDVLPTLDQFSQIDFIYGYLGDDAAPGGQIQNQILLGIEGIPEPGTIVLAASAVAGSLIVGTRRRSRAQQI